MDTINSAIVAMTPEKRMLRPARLASYSRVYSSVTVNRCTGYLLSFHARVYLVHGPQTTRQPLTTLRRQSSSIQRCRR